MSIGYHPSAYKFAVKFKITIGAIVISISAHFVAGNEFFDVFDIRFAIVMAAVDSGLHICCCSTKRDCLQASRR